MLNAVLELAVRRDNISRNPARGTDLPTIHRAEAAYFEADVVDRIVETVPAVYAPFIAVQGVLGLRFGEAAALRRSSVNFLTRRLEITESLAEISGSLVFGPTKTHANRKVPLTAAPLWAMLADHLDAHVGKAADSLLFTSVRGFPVRYSRFRPTVWVPVLQELGLPVTGMHVLRHSAAARMIAAGWQAKAVQSALGHRSAAFTLTTYGHLYESDWNDMGAALYSFPRRTGAEQAISDAQEGRS